MKDLIQLIANALVDNPNEVTIDEVGGNNTTVFALSAAKGDVGKIIGKQGKTVQAMRTILNAVSVKEKKRIILEIIE